MQIHSRKFVIIRAVCLLVLVCVISSCGGGGATTFTVGGTVSGLIGSGLVLQNNSGDDLTISTGGSFAFATGLADGVAYSVTVKIPPSSPTQSCSVTNGTGTIAAANVTNVAVNCENNEDPPKIYDIGITLSPYDPNTNFAGDVSFSGLQYDERVFIEFGGLLSGLPNVHPTFIVPLGTKIHSVSSGIVSHITTLGSNDYDICVHRNADDEWCVSYEHIMNIQVSEGATIAVGDVVGEAGRINDTTESGKFDLKVWRGGTTILDYCPYILFDDSVAADMQAKITRFASDWEGFIGTSVYNEDAWVSPGCVYETLSE